MFEARFFGVHPDGIEAFRQAVKATARMLTSALPDQPCSGAAPAALNELLRTEICPPTGRPLSHALERVRAIVGHSVALWHPNVVAHLHCPVAIPALAAEMVVSALNQSMNSFDQAPAATVIEQQVTAWLCALSGFPATAGGTFTAGGTQSNLMGLLLARDHFLRERWQWDAATFGLPPDASRLRILCSDAAHFSVEKSALQLGLGTAAVQRVETEAGAMSADRLTQQIRGLRRDRLRAARDRGDGGDNRLRRDRSTCRHRGNRRPRTHLAPYRCGLWRRLAYEPPISRSARRAGAGRIRSRSTFTRRSSSRSVAARSCCATPSAFA